MAAPTHSAADGADTFEARALMRDGGADQVGAVDLPIG
jgi:hypothetical protein